MPGFSVALWTQHQLLITLRAVALAQMNTKLQLRWVFAVQAVLLVVAAVRNVHQLNPDAVAYMRIAGYYAGGQWDLAVTGYWGPLLSWLMVPLLKAGMAPLVAARVVMALSGVVFLCGAVAVFRSFRLPRLALVTGAWIAAGWSVFWSVRNISPDLLMAGLVGLAVRATVEGFLFARRSRLIAAGTWWGVAFLAKAVALPLAVLVTASFIGFAASGRPELRRGLAVRLGTVWLCLTLMAGPWIGGLSLHYGKFTFSTTGPIAHALAGPGERSRYHPAMVTLHQPDAGRVTQWEEPSRMAYRFWSPFSSAENFRHQLEVVWWNAGTIASWLQGVRWLTGAEDVRSVAGMLPGFDLLGLSLVAVAGGLAVGCIQARRLRRVRWCWAVGPVVCLGGLYLPFWVQAEDQRYFYAALPFVWVLVIGGWRWTCAQGWIWTRTIRLRLFRLAAVAFLIPAGLWLSAAIWGIPNPASRTARELSAELGALRVNGPFAGSASLTGGRTGLYTAFLLGERWLGDDAAAPPAAFEAAGVRVVFLRSSPQAEAFAADSRWRKLDTRAGQGSILVYARVSSLSP